MNKFKQVLSDDELDALVVEYGSNRTPPARNLLKAIEQAVLSKIVEQKPVAWLIPEGYGSPVTLNENEAKHLKDEWKLDIKPLYILPSLEVTYGLRKDPLC